MFTVEMARFLAPILANIGKRKRCTSPRNGKKRAQTAMKRKRNGKKWSEAETKRKESVNLGKHPVKISGWPIHLKIKIRS